MSTWTIFVTDGVNKNRPVKDLKAEMTVKDFKQKILDQLGNECSRLLFGGKPLRDHVN